MKLNRYSNTILIVVGLPGIGCQNYRQTVSTKLHLHGRGNKIVNLTSVANIIKNIKHIWQLVGALVICVEYEALVRNYFFASASSFGHSTLIRGTSENLLT